MRISQSLKYKIKRTFPKLSYGLLNFFHPYRKQKVKILQYYGVDVVFDVGANIGLYAHYLRYNGYQGRIISFEPLSKVYEELKSYSESDPLWEAVNYAIGNEDGEITINISDNSICSSALNILKESLEIVPEARYVAQEKAKIRKIDTIINDLVDSSSKIFVKIDTQGFEKQVIDGALNSLNRILGFQLELSLRRVYEGETLFKDMLDYMYSLGYKLVGVEVDWYDEKSGEIIQMDGIFIKA